jgi:hypothetical protein
MADKERPERSTRPPEMVVISVTVRDLSPVDGRPLGARLAATAGLHTRLVAGVVALALAAPAAIVLPRLVGRRPAGPAVTLRGRQVQHGERMAVARALGYPYPLLCLSMTILAGSPGNGHAVFHRIDGCGSYHQLVADRGTEPSPPPRAVFRWPGR